MDPRATAVHRSVPAPYIFCTFEAATAVSRSALSGKAAGATLLRQVRRNKKKLKMQSIVRSFMRFAHSVGLAAIRWTSPTAAVADDDSIRQQLQAYMDNLADQSRFSGAVVLATANNVIFHGATTAKPPSPTIVTASLIPNLTSRPSARCSPALLSRSLLSETCFLMTICSSKTSPATGIRRCE